MPTRPPLPHVCALLGWDHPHAAALLATLDNLPEVGGVYLWDDRPPVRRSGRAPRSKKLLGVSLRLGELLARPEVSFVIVCTRHDRAAAVARRALRAGKHLLAEKPVALTPPGIARLQALARARGLRASVLYVRRLHPAVQAMRRLVRPGKMGRLLSLEVRFLVTQVRFREPRSWLFRRRLAGGGILTWLGCHYLDLIAFVTGDPVVAVSARLARRSGERTDVEDVAALVLELRSGAVATLHLGYTLAGAGRGYLNAAGNDGYFACHGTRGRVVWPAMNEPRLLVERASRPPGRATVFPLPATSSYAGTPGEALVRQFVRSLRGRAAPPTTLEDARQVALVIAAARRADRTGRRQRPATP